MKKMLVVIILVVFVLVIAGVFWYAPALVVVRMKAECEEQLSDDALFVRALKDSSGGLCGELADAIDRIVCRAWATGRPEECPETILSCAPIAKKDPSACPEGDSWCMAVASGNKKYCEGELEEERAECVAWAERNASFFTNVEECVGALLARKALTEDKKSLCKKIRDPNQRINCFRNFEVIS